CRRVGRLPHRRPSSSGLTRAPALPGSGTPRGGRQESPVGPLAVPPPASPFTPTLPPPGPTFTGPPWPPMGVPLTPPQLGGPVSRSTELATPGHRKQLPERSQWTSMVTSHVSVAGHAPTREFRHAFGVAGPLSRSSRGIAGPGLVLYR